MKKLVVTLVYLLWLLLVLTVVLVDLGLIGACATERPAPRTAQWTRDHDRCLKEAVEHAQGSYVTAPIAQARLQRQLYASCMAVAGY